MIYQRKGLAHALRSMCTYSQQRLKLVLVVVVVDVVDEEKDAAVGA